MNWDKLQKDLDATVRSQTVQFIDDTIAYLQAERAKLVNGDTAIPPPIDQRKREEPDRVPVAMKPAGLTPPPPAPKERKYSTRPQLQKNCAECGNPFFPKHGRQTICSDECRDIRKARHIEKMKADYHAKRADKIERDDQEARELMQAAPVLLPPPDSIPDTGVLAQRFGKNRLPPRSNPQSAPRIKLKRVILPPSGEYAAPGTAEAAAAVERVRQMPKTEGTQYSRKADDQQEPPVLDDEPIPF